MNWHKYSLVDYENYLNDFYSNLESRSIILNSDADSFSESIIDYRRLIFNHDLGEVERALERISSRRKVRSSIYLEKSVKYLKDHYDDLNALFLNFSPN